MLLTLDNPKVNFHYPRLIATLYLIYSPLKTHKSYEKELENRTSCNQLHHCRHSGRSRWSNGDVRCKRALLTMENTRFKISQYACAVLLIVSSIALVAYQVVEIDDVASGLLYYVAQSFLLAGSIFGLDQYIKHLIKK